MVYNTSWIRKLYFNSIKNKFNWEKYINPKPYFGVMIMTNPLYQDSSMRNICGYVISFPYQHHLDIEYNWNEETFKIGSKQIIFNSFSLQPTIK